MSKPDIRPTLPWWRVPIVWLVIGGPLLVVIASTVTLVLALSGGDRPLGDTRSVAAPESGALAPATQARNHAVTSGR